MFSTCDSLCALNRLIYNHDVIPAHKHKPGLMASSQYVCLNNLVARSHRPRVKIVLNPDTHPQPAKHTQARGNPVVVRVRQKSRIACGLKSHH